ncbi:Actin patches distal protein 1 [Grifola frondosa]|uniref:Actin patches distal protein 1 n=1 Tax=Grifola frondosa TaxID=5627 RepID=A0A1C7MME3_GRIFR|nr:Actin patches distal protein 1 [Grifola frondosa]
MVAITLRSPKLRPLFSCHFWTVARTFSSTTSTSCLAGTVISHNSYILLHTHRAPSEYPAKISSPLQKALQLKAGEWGGIVNFAWSPGRAVHDDYKGLGEDPREREMYCATAFSLHLGPVFIPEISLENLDVQAQVLSALSSQLPSADHPFADRGKLFLYVCNHAARDCRCGETGGEVGHALRTEVEKRGRASEIIVGNVGHVGGHKYAANLLVFPHGDWLGTVQAVDVPQILDEIIHRHFSPRIYPEPPLCPPFWRGRMGLTKEEQLALFTGSF